MSISALDIFKIGIGPSSSHTVGPMKAAHMFVRVLLERALSHQAVRIETTLFGSLGATGRGHRSGEAVMLGLAGHEPDAVDPDRIEEYLSSIAKNKKISICPKCVIDFDAARDLRFSMVQHASNHPNAMQFTAFDANGTTLIECNYLSVGGGFVVSADMTTDAALPEKAPIPALPFRSGAELLSLTKTHFRSIADVMHMHEARWRSQADTDAALLNVWKCMQSCIDRGCRTEGLLPGGFGVRRRASALLGKLTANKGKELSDPLRLMDWVNLFALSVNEENAGGGRVVTAPTNGAAGIIPAVLSYYDRFVEGANEQGIINFLLTAAAIGILYKENASISGAEVGCQGEVGVACSMAAAGLCAVLGGSPEQVENAAEIGMEHHLVSRPVNNWH